MTFPTDAATITRRKSRGTCIAMLSSSIAAHALLFAFLRRVRGSREALVLGGSLELPEAQKLLFSAASYHCLFPSAREQGADAFESLHKMRPNKTFGSVEQSKGYSLGQWHRPEHMPQ